MPSTGSSMAKWNKKPIFEHISVCSNNLLCSQNNIVTHYNQKFNKNATSYRVWAHCAPSADITSNDGDDA